MTSQGNAHARFRRALDRGNATDALSAAAELPQIGLTEALALCLLLADDESARFERAALRWHGRFCREVGDVSLAEAQAVLALPRRLAREESRAGSTLARGTLRPPGARPSERGAHTLG